jgi:hypothetical protein
MELGREVAQILRDVTRGPQSGSHFGRDRRRDGDLLDRPPLVLSMCRQEAGDVAVKHGDVCDEAVGAALAAAEADALLRLVEGDQIDRRSSGRSRVGPAG